MIYTKTEGPKGGIVYRENGKAIKSANVPEEVLELLQSEKEVKFSPCIFCGQRATKIRYFNSMIVDLCDSDYYSHNLGQIAHKLREGEDNGANAKVSQTSKEESQPNP